MTDIEITSDFSSVIETTKAIKNLDDTIAKAVASIIAENKRWERASKASADVQIQAIDRVIEAEEKLSSSQWFAAQRRKLDMMKASEALAKKNEEAVLKEVKATLRQIEAVEKLNAAKAKSFQESIGKNLGLGAVGISATESASVFQEEFNRQAEQAAQRLDYLKGKYDSAYQAERLYTVATRELTEAIENQVGDVSVLQKRLDDLNKQYRLIGTSADRTAEAFVKQQTVLQGNTQKLSRFGQATQQFGYQAGDFIVQVQSGTNAFVAFGQQATQLAGLLVTSLNPAVMAWGVALSVVIPLLTAVGAAWSRTTDKTEDYKKPLEDALEITKKLREETDKIRFPDQTTKVVDDLKTKLKEAEKVVADFDQKIRNLRFSAYSTTRQDLSEGVREAQINLESLKEEIRLRDLIVRIENTRQAQGAAQLAIQQQLKQAHAQQLAYMGRTVQQSNTYLQNTIKAYNVYAQSRIAASVMAGWKETEKLIEKQQKAADKATYMKNVFHALAGEASSVSVYLGGWAGLIDAATKAANRMRGAFGRGLPAIPGGPREGGTAAPIISPRPRNRNEMLFDEYFGPDTGSAGVGGGAPTQSALEQLQKQLNLEQELLGTSEAYQRVRQALGDDFAKTQPQVIDGLVAQIEAVEQLKKVEEDRKKIMDTVKSSLEDSFMSMVDGTKSVKDAFKDMARDIIKELYRVLVVQRLVNSISGAIGGAFGIPTTAQANGGVWSGGTQIKAYANGGVVGSPTYFPMANGRTGLMGEAGPEAIMPLKRGPDGKLGVQASGGGNVTVNNVINISGTGDGAYVRSEISKALPQIVGATKSAVIDARRRGGQMAAAFS